MIKTAQSTIRLSPDARAMQQALSAKLGLSLTSVTEMAIRLLGEREGVTPGTAPMMIGHASDELRSAFQAWIEEGQRGAEGKRLAKSLWNCTDILPRAACDALDLPPGSSYAQAARKVARKATKTK